MGGGPRPPGPLAQVGAWPGSLRPDSAWEPTDPGPRPALRALSRALEGARIRRVADSGRIGLRTGVGSAARNARRDGGIGRRGGLKNLWAKALAGSSPAPGIYL
jgi:hypothetical protein